MDARMLFLLPRIEASTPAVFGGGRFATCSPPHTPPSRLVARSVHITNAAQMRHFRLGRGSRGSTLGDECQPCEHDSPALREREVARRGQRGAQRSAEQVPKGPALRGARRWPSLGPSRLRRQSSTNVDTPNLLHWASPVFRTLA